MPKAPKDPNCPACAAGRMHTTEEWAHHPQTGADFSVSDGQKPVVVTARPEVVAQRNGHGS